MQHPLDRFTHCPACGSSQFSIDTFKSKHCDACGFVYFANPSAATGAFILRDGCLLVARRAQEPASGTLDLPGGFVDIGETVEQGMAREIREETGLEALAMHYLFSIPNVYPYSGMPVRTIDMFYLVEVAPDAQPQAADDAAALQWVPLSQIVPTLFGMHSVSQAVDRFLASQNARKS